MAYKYRTAEESRKPGYLAKQFARIKKEQAKIAEGNAASKPERASNVHVVKVAR